MVPTPPVVAVPMPFTEKNVEIAISAAMPSGSSNVPNR